MDKEQVIKEMKSLGIWQSANTYLGDGIYTRHNVSLDYLNSKNGAGSNGVHLRIFMQAMQDITNKPFDKLRVLDLGSLEGLHSIEPALHGAEVVSVEGREEHCEKQRFVKKVLNLNNLHIHCDDVRNCTLEKYGEFDVIINAGILYHLSFPEQIDWMEGLSKMCKKLMLIHTNYNHDPSKNIEVQHKGEKYSGFYFKERTGESKVTKDGRTHGELNNRGSIGNEESFLLDKPSIYKLLNRIGFNISFERKAIGIKEIFVAIKGKPIILKTIGDLKEMEI